MKWLMVGSAVALSVITISSTCHLRSWRDWAVFLANAAVWQGVGIYAWQYWAEIEERERASGHDSN